MLYYFTAEDDAAAKALSLSAAKLEGAIILRSSSTWAVAGNAKYIDHPACILRGINVFRAWHMGGTIICFPGDLSVMELKMGPSDFGQTAIQRVRDYLVSIGCQADVDDNDLIVSGEKCGSWACMSESGYAQTVVHFSVNMDVELVGRVCTKPMVKTPGALSKYGVTADDLLEVIRCLL